MEPGARIVAWQPPVPGLREVLHASFPNHAYPMHTHDCWTLLLVDEGMVRYDLDRHQHGAMTSLVTLLPPNIPHDGRSVHPEGFRKRVLYLDEITAPDDTPGRTGLTGVAVDHPGLTDPLLRRRIHQLHNVLAWRTEDLEAQSRLLFIRERLSQHLLRSRSGRPRSACSTGAPTSGGTIRATGSWGEARPTGTTAATRSTDDGADIGGPQHRARGVAGELRDLLDAHIQPGLPLDEAARLLHCHPTHLVRTFSREFGIPPHLYLTGRRVELARGHLLAGLPAAEVAALAGFYDQSHLTRHFRRMLGVTPTQYARAKPDHRPLP